MRAVLISLTCLAMACSGTDAIDSATETATVLPPQPVASIVIDVPPTLVIGHYVPVKVTLRDAANTEVSRPLVFASSDPTVATVDENGNVHALKEGYASISVYTEGKSAQAGMNIVQPAPERCRDGFDFCVVNVYDLKRVNGLALPVKSPWGIGEWDYDADAGTWMLVGAALTLFDDGNFQFSMVHSAASGAAVFGFNSGPYISSAGSVLLIGLKGDQRTATVAGDTLTVEWEKGLTFTFKARFSD